MAKIEKCQHPVIRGWADASDIFINLSKVDTIYHLITIKSITKGSNNSPSKCIAPEMGHFVWQKIIPD